MTVNDPEANAIAMNQPIARQRDIETPRQTAARLRAKHGIVIGDHAKSPLPKPTFDELWD